MQDLIDTKMADEIARDQRKHCNGGVGDLSSGSSKDKTATKSTALGATSPSLTKTRFSLRWT